MNVWTGIGRISNELEIKTGGNTKYCFFSLAIERGDKKKTTDFIPCVAFEKTAEFIKEYMTTGIRVGVEGRIQVNQKEVAGKKTNKVVVVVNKVHFADRKVEKENIEENDFLTQEEKELPF